MRAFDEIGGEVALRAIIDRFVDRMFDDVMIGFMFAKASRERIKRFEYQHAAKFLGADIEYAGRPLDAAHKRHRIFGGQFERRKELLRQELVRAHVPEPIQRAWLDHTESLRAMITGHAGSQCG